MTYTAEEKYREAARELAMRQRVFKRLIDSGKMTADDAARKIEIMQDIAADYLKLVEAERLL